MNALDPLRTDPARFLRRSAAFACATLLLLGSSANATTVLQFSQEFPTDVITATATGGVTTLATTGNPDGGLVSIPVVVSNFLGSPEPPGFVLFETFAGVHSVGPATSSAGTICQDFTGTVEFTSLPGGAGVNYLTAAFGSMTLFSGSSFSASLNGSEPGDSVVFTSAFASGFSNNALSLSLTLAKPLSIDNSVPGSPTVAGFTAQNTGTFRSTSIPEPGTLCLASFGVVFGMLVYRKKRMKA